MHISKNIVIYKYTPQVVAGSGASLTKALESVGDQYVTGLEFLLPPWMRGAFSRMGMAT